MQLVELHHVEPQLHADGGLQHERLVLLPCHDLHGQPLQVIELRTVEGLDERFGVGFEGRLPTQMPCRPLCRGQHDAQVVVGIVDDVCLEARRCQLTGILGYECETHVEHVTALSLHRLGLEGHRSVGRVIILIIRGYATRGQGCRNGFVAHRRGTVSRCCRLGLLAGTLCRTGVWPLEIIGVGLYHHHLRAEHRDVKAILVFNKYDVLALKARYGSASHFIEEAHFLSYFHSVCRFCNLGAKVVKNVHTCRLDTQSLMFFVIRCAHDD